MTRKNTPPVHLVLPDPRVPDDFGNRLDALKAESGLTWEGMSDCIGVDLRQLHRWRLGTAPSGHALFSLFLFASRVQGGLRILLAKPAPERPSTASASGAVAQLPLDSAPMAKRRDVPYGGPSRLN